MDTERHLVALALILIGVLLMGLGIWARVGRNRAWYLVPDYYVLLPKGTHYALPIASLMIILVGTSLLVPTSTISRSIWIFGIFPLAFLVMLVIVFQPSWLKPAWIRWLEENHGDILDILIEEGRKTPNWGKRVSTQEGLVEWVKEVKRKYGLK